MLRYCSPCSFYSWLCMRLQISVCVCVCVCEREREREISATLVSSGNSSCIFSKQTLRSILITKANKMHYFSTLFGKELCMIRTDLLSIIRSLNTVFTAVGICHTSYVACLLARSASGQATQLV